MIARIEEGTRRAAVLGIAVLGIALALAACTETPTTADAGRADASASDAGTTLDAGGSGRCEVNEVSLTLTISAGGFADDQLVPITYRGEEGYLAIDTGSPLTFVFGDPDGPTYVDDAGEVEIGCERFGVPAVTLEAIGREPFRDRYVLGILGLDFFASAPSELDYPGRRVVRHLDGRPDFEDATIVDVAWNGDRIVVEATFDGEPLRLMYDAGSPHTLWVGQMARPGDEEVELNTVDGGSLLAYEGTAVLAFAGETRTVPVWRTERFEYLEEELMELGAVGLFGVSSLGFRRLVFDLEHDRLGLGPRVSP
ncbi:MAG: hypothetical protein AB7S26_03485 [Sandaracinaceae bacterium]